MTWDPMHPWVDDIHLGRTVRIQAWRSEDRARRARRRGLALILAALALGLFLGWLTAPWMVVPR